jgi:hypothetical protein
MAIKVRTSAHYVVKQRSRRRVVFLAKLEDG